MARIAQEMFIVGVDKDMGKEGTSLLPNLLRQVRAVHEAISTERLPFGLTVAVSTVPERRMLSGPYATLADASHLTAIHDGVSPLSIQAQPDGQLLVWATEHPQRPSGDMLIYAYSGPYRESIITPLGSHTVPTSGFPSYFSVPYFRDLYDAMLHYGATCVREAQCDLIDSAWREPERLVFLPKPEVKMRRSLQRFLRHSLREHQAIEVMPEQNVNESRPVDIKVTWTSSNRVALIEIKWLGMSARVGAKRYTQKFDGDRARDGASQLVEYLDEYHVNSPGQEVRGFLTVFDGQRLNVKPSSTSLTSAEASFFANVEIEYPEEILKRPDFDPPIRLYCGPGAT